MDSFIVHSVLVVLIVLSIATWSIAILKLKLLKKVAAETHDFNQSFWNANSWEKGQAIAKDAKGDVAGLAMAGF
jgi:biopolymer transport protein ExbB/TolQ